MAYGGKCTEMKELVDCVRNVRVRTRIEDQSLTKVLRQFISFPEMLEKQDLDLGRILNKHFFLNK